jgi:hypothetical protein
LKLIDAPIPVGNLTRGCWRLRRGTAGGRRSSPLRCWRSTDSRSLIRLGVNILGNRRWSTGLGLPLHLALQQLQTSLDMYISRIQVGSAAVRIQGIGSLVVARLVKCSQIIPDFGDVRIQANSTGVGIQGIAILVDLIVEHTNRAPEGWVATVAVDCLLVCLVCLGVFLLRHIAAAEEVPALSIVIVCGKKVSLLLVGNVCKSLPALTDFSRYSMAFSWLA